MSQPLPLSTYPLATVLQKWRNEELTVEQMLGHLLQHQITQESQTLALQKEVQRLQQMIQLLRQT